MQHGIRIASVTALIVTVVALCTAAPAWAGGVEVLEQGRGVGNANAGVRATADDPTTVYWNPAGMTRFERSAYALHGSAILPNSDFVSAGSTRLPGVPFTGESGTTDNPIYTGGLFGVWSLGSRWKLGLGVNVPFGLETDWGRTWIGRYHATKSDLLTININPALAYKLGRNWSIAVGGSAMYCEANLDNALDFGAALGAPQTVDGHVNMNGDSWGFGFNAGILWEPTPCTRIGLSYRSQVKQELEGIADFEVPAAAALLPIMTGRFRDSKVSTEVTLPDTLGLSIYQQLGRKWAILADATWTGWSSFDQLVVDFENPAEPNSVTPWNWDDTWRAALGVNWMPNSCWTVHVGAAWDQSPIPDATRTPRIPGNDRIWAAVGVGFKPARNWTIDVYYAHIFVDDAPMNQGDAARGFLVGQGEASVDVAGIQISFGL